MIMGTPSSPPRRMRRGRRRAWAVQPGGRRRPEEQAAATPCAGQSVLEHAQVQVRLLQSHAAPRAPARRGARRPARCPAARSRRHARPAQPPLMPTPSLAQPAGCAAACIPSQRARARSVRGEAPPWGRLHPAGRAQSQQARGRPHHWPAAAVRSPPPALPGRSWAEARGAGLVRPPAPGRLAGAEEQLRTRQPARLLRSCWPGWPAASWARATVSAAGCQGRSRRSAGRVTLQMLGGTLRQEAHPHVREQSLRRRRAQPRSSGTWAWRRRRGETRRWAGLAGARRRWRGIARRWAGLAEPRERSSGGRAGSGTQCGQPRGAGGWHGLA